MPEPDKLAEAERWARAQFAGSTASRGYRDKLRVLMAEFDRLREVEAAARGALGYLDDLLTAATGEQPYHRLRAVRDALAAALRPDPGTEEAKS